MREADFPQPDHTYKALVNSNSTESQMLCAVSQKGAKYKAADANPFSLNVSLHKIQSRIDCQLKPISYLKCKT